MTIAPEHKRNNTDKCARGVCEADISEVSFTHRHSGYRYCIRCARKINDACPEAPPFDLRKPS